MVRMIGLKFVLGFLNYCQETRKHKQKSKINQHIILENNRKKKHIIENIKPTMGHYLKHG